MKKLLLLLTALVSFQTAATDILVWDKKRLTIKLEVGKERIVEFPDNIRYGIPSAVLKKMNVDSQAGVLYLLPRAPFPETDIKVTLASTSEQVLVTMFAVRPQDDLPLEDVKVITKSESDKQDKQDQELLAKSSDVSLKQAIQFASQDLFAPPDYQKMVLPIQISEVRKPLNLELMFQGFSAGIFDLKAIKQYRTQKLTVTAIVATNRTDQVQPIVYSHLENTGYITVTSQHKQVQPAGSEGQSTVLYYVTERPLTTYKTYQ